MMEITTPETQNDNTERDQNCFTSDTVSLLSTGLLHIYKPSLAKTKEQLTELTNKQSVILEQLHNENLTVSKHLNSEELQGIFNTIKLYQIKLINIKKEMKSLHDRSIRLKKRALRLQQFNEKENYIQKERIKREEELIGNSST